MPQLQIRQRGDVLRLLTLDMTLLSIGRTPDNGLPLREATVAIRHAEISLQNEVCLLTGLSGEQSPTFVNGQRLAPNQPHRLAYGDEIQIGSFTLTFMDSGSTGQATGDPALPAPPASQRGAVSHGTLAAYPPAAARPTAPGLLPDPHTAALYSEYLPPFFQESGFLTRYLKVFQAIWEPLQLRQDDLHLYFSPLVAPPRMLHWMAGWLDVPLEPHWPEARQRQWIDEIITIYRWRGTRYGLTRALETVFGLSPVLREDPGHPHVLQVEVLDSLDGDDSASRDAVTRFIEQQVPAHTRVEVTFFTASHAGGEARP